MDIKEKVKTAAEKIASDKELQAQFAKDPEKAIEKVLGVDIPDGVADQVIAAVKTKMAGDKAAAGLGALKKMIK